MPREQRGFAFARYGAGARLAGLAAFLVAAGCEPTVSGPATEGDHQPATLAANIVYSPPIDLGNFSPLAINNAGIVVGGKQSILTGPAVRWQAGVLTDIGTPAGCLTSVARDINAAGVITGFCTTNFLSRAFRWYPSTGTMVLLTGGDFTEGWAINTAGRVVGYQSRPGDPTHALWWGRLNLFPPHDINPSGYISSTAFGVNSAGDMVGCAEKPGSFAFIWYHGGATQDLGIDGCARDVNDDLQVVGNGGAGGFFWTASGGIQNLGFTALHINAVGRVVGGYISSGSSFTWRDGVLTPLPPAIPNGYALAFALNDCGVVVGEAEFTPSQFPRHAAMWIPSTCEN